MPPFSLLASRFSMLQGKNERAVALAMCTVTRFYTAMMDHNVVAELPEVSQNM